ncbi:alpha/beta hydrolase family protein [Auraticoccus monumenti]|uniref:alpha/beta hydrolase family protein n=1 Tax=Auraticoccus monumenti TaxID=675864 RepID=UPI0018D307CE|nr:alpha/beta hydrolase [Auraticoccus monumenti]
MRDAPLRESADPRPLVVLSHGTGGLAGGLSWLATRLAGHGYVVVGVDHHGNTGSEPYLAEGFLCLWERARDVSALLDDPGWRAAVGGAIATEAVVAGFSAGAHTALLLLGARVAHSQFEPGNPEVSPVRGPRELPDLADRLPSLISSSGVFAAAWDRRRASFRDQRITAALAMAPGRSVRGLDPRTLAAIERPLTIAVGGSDTAAPPDQCAAWLHQRVPGSQLHTVHPAAGHYVFLPEPTPEGRAAAPDLFTDAPGVVRSEVHETTAALVQALPG